MTLWWWGPGTDCPEKLWLPPPWQCSRPGWTGLWATWSGGRCPCPWQGGWIQMIFKVPSNPTHSWFCTECIAIKKWSSSERWLMQRSPNQQELFPIYLVVVKALCSHSCVGAVRSLITHSDCCKNNCSSLKTLSQSQWCFYCLEEYSLLSERILLQSITQLLC